MGYLPDFLQEFAEGDFLDFLNEFGEQLSMEGPVDALVAAMSAGDALAALQLLERHSHLLHARTPYQGEPMLNVAAFYGMEQLVAFMLERFADPAARDHAHIGGVGKTAALAAASEGHAGLVAMLLDRPSADINESGGAQQMGPQACAAGWPEAEHKARIYGGCDGDWNDGGWTALMQAARWHDVRLAALLLWRGANVHCRSRHGLTAADLAARPARKELDTAERQQVLHMLAWVGAERPAAMLEPEWAYLRSAPPPALPPGTA